MQSIERDCEVLVAGGGAAGIAAAVAAARHGASVILCERYGFLGGLATAAEVGTICGLYYREFESPFRWAVSGVAREFAERVARASNTAPIRHREGLAFLPYNAFQFRRVCDEMTREAGVALFLHTTVTDTAPPRAGAPWRLRALANGTLVNISAKSVVDCSGEGTIAALSGARLLESDRYQAGAVVFSMAGISSVPEATLRMEITRALAARKLSGECEDEETRVSIVPGSVRRGQVSLKVALPSRISSELNSLTALELRARELIEKIASALIAEVPSLHKAGLSSVAPQIGVRTGRRIAGQALLTDDDVLGCRPQTDGVAIGAWPIEEWLEAREPSMQYFELGGAYEIHARALRSVDIESLWMGGRNISATDGAIASARVIGTALSTGYAAGSLASTVAKSGDLSAEIARLGREIRSERVTAQLG